MPATDSAIYLDYGATTPVDPRVLDQMLPYFTERFGNPGSHAYQRGRDAEAVVVEARNQVANLIGASPTELTFTAGATESNNLALKGIASAWDNDCSLIISATEHPSIMQTARFLQNLGVRVTVLPVGSNGRPDPEALRSLLGADRVLVSIMHANNETGVVNPIERIAQVCREEGALFHCDAAQTTGKVPIDLSSLNVDLLSLSAHKFYGPKGVGALYVRRRTPKTRVEILLHGGQQEQGLRSGTLNVPGIVGLGAAAEIALGELGSEATRLQSLRDRMLNTFRTEVGRVELNGCPEHRLPGQLNLSFQDVGAEHLQFAVRDRVELSAGSACSTGTPGPSASITALGLSDDRIHGAIRIVLGRFTTSDDANTATQVIAAAVRSIRG